MELDTGQSWSMFSRIIGSLKADGSTKALYQMGEPLLNFIRKIIGSTSTTYLNSASPQLLNLGSPMPQCRRHITAAPGCSQENALWFGRGTRGSS